ncbi:hypothetical protein A5641_02850 [Mycobacterium sp. 1554424.7]|nr:hypothetical protein A5641_02850 [Mycobacterium sp. 1554424.7]
MTIRIGRTAAAVCGGGALVLAAGFGVAGADEPSTGATAPASSVAPTTGGGGGAISVRPAGGGACIVGLNCGCIPHRTCPTPHPRPNNTGENQHNAPAPQNP